MQPYFFPYLGYFDIANCVDRWIVFDTVQYIRRGWIHRNRILHPTQGWQYIIVPTRKHLRETAILDVAIDDKQDWKRRILGQLQHYEKRARHFSKTMSLVEDCLAVQETSISRLNTSVLSKVCDALRIRFDYSFLSEMDLDLGHVEGPGDWAPRICEALGAEEYVNPPGGVGIYDKGRFADLNIKLTIRNLPPLEYTCRGYEFIPNLSILDLLMWNDPEAIKSHLEEHR
jgi:hypothetical protein